ncbi:isocitrate lyase/PEP mutase family protein [Usitatibacter palustris]|uniref:Carboxyvinyl-carboxyphosphonate phosphorylmutase n=1 Tax=Usitatibacter palustris TaxID=2732487 RepID=A0A6M4H6Z0_9PROT|nr:isocitrate lyase/phosphoenolpyruvate mutase family protein [Usitatibacter palustris]QJR13727.1 Carboxyvinyl-carboxyphosphonate phosphorylmutase [Usitatibacter palustris]
MTSQKEKAARFQALHEAKGAFVFPNPWDGGSGRILAGLGFQALATSSGASANVLGKLDGNVTRDEALAHAKAIVEATDLPVAADLEKGFGDSPDDVAETIRRAAAVGLVGGSIEDATGEKEKPRYEIAEATERIEAAVRAARSLPFHFTLTARTENYLRGFPDLDDTIKRLQAFEAAGADVLFAPGLPDLDAVRKVCAALKKPVNFMVGIRGKSFTVAELEAAGVKRISLATSLYRAAMAGLVEAAQEINRSGTFTYLDHMDAVKELASYMRR